MAYHLYLVSCPPAKCGYDRYSEFVVLAQSAEDARLVHPDGMPLDAHDASILRDWLPAAETDVLVVKHIGDPSTELMQEMTEILDKDADFILVNRPPALVITASFCAG